MKLNKETYKKVGVVYGILIILILVALGIRWWQGKSNISNNKSVQNKITPLITPKSVSKSVIYVGKFSLESKSLSYKVGTEFDVNVIFDSPKKVLDGADIVLKFNPNILNALGITEGTYFKLIPRKDIDNKVGSIKVTALDAAIEKPPIGKVSFGIIHFQAKKAGTSIINFEFLQGSTSKTTLVEKASSLNILGRVEGITITVTK